MRCLTVVGLFALSLMANVQAGGLYTGTQLETPCPALVGLCLERNAAALAADDPKAQFWMGKYQFMMGDHSFAAALPWYERAASQGYAPALVMTAIYYWHGAGDLPRNRDRAVDMMTMAAENGYGPARQLLEYMEDSSLSEREMAMLIRF